MLDETVTISKKEYDELKDRDLFLIALENAGVDNWEGWGEAWDLFDEMKKEKEE